MNGGSIATRYAKALFEEAKVLSIDHAVFDIMKLLGANMKETPELRNALASHRISKDKKERILLTASGTNVPYVYQKFIRLVLKHNRETFMHRITFIYCDLYREHHGIDLVEFETAVPVNEHIISKVTDKIAAKTGHAVELVTTVTPSLLGGFRIRIGDIQYDHSYRYKLNKIKEKLQ